MPKTYTDDIAAALPSSIDGPFQVVDPSDIGSWIKVDPALSQISAGGGARPMRSLNMVYVRTYSVTSSVYFGFVTARRITAGFNGGFYLNPWRIPDDMDVTEPSNVKILVATGATGPASAKVVRILLSDTYIRASVATSDTITFDWTAPVSWQLGDYRTLLVDNGNGRTYEANHFAIGDLLGLRLSRNGSAAEDTYTTYFSFAEFITFEYTAKVF